VLDQTPPRWQSLNQRLQQWSKSSLFFPFILDANQAIICCCDSPHYLIQLRVHGFVPMIRPKPLIMIPFDDGLG
jgi:hypothetical protein